MPTVYEEAANVKPVKQVEMVMEMIRIRHLDSTNHHMLCRLDEQGCIFHHRNIQERSQGC